MSFKTIETQEELDQIITSRLARQKETLEKQYADDNAQLKTRNEELEKEIGALQTTVAETNGKAKKFDETIADLNAKIAGYETASLRTKIAIKNGLPLDLADRLVGDDEETLEADAQRIAGYVKPAAPVPPLKSTEQDSSEVNPLRKMLKNMTAEGE